MITQSARQGPLLTYAGESWEGKRVLVVGLARSGLAAARLLLAAGAKPILHDLKRAEDLGAELAPLAENGCELCLGVDPLPLLDSADMLVISPGVPIDSPIISAARSRDLLWMGEMEMASRFARGHLYAVTGTNGKTTTVSLLGDIFKKSGRIAHVCGNVGYPLSSAVLSAAQDDTLVTEVSSFQLESVEHFHPHIAAILNLTPDHLNRHGNMENYARLKRRIFENQTEDDYGVFNRDDPALRSMAEGLRCRILWFSRAEEVKQGAFVRGGRVVFRMSGEEQDMGSVSQIKLPGAHNLENVLAAVCIAGLAKVPPAVIRYSLRSFAGVEHRIEFVRELQGVRYINDSKGTNPDASIKAIEAMSAPTVLLAGGYDKKVSFSSLARAIAASGRIRHVVLFGQTAKLIESALLKEDFGMLSTCATLDEALHQARERIEPGWNVLFSPACASFDQYTDYEQRGRHFKELVRALTDARGTPYA
ncbi:MAG: UDP-N-acetylmuramoyl-L-alanine--D-glutamate ligase [Christensenellales bacterium]